MRRPPTILVGCIVFLSAVVGFLITRYLVESRTLFAVDMPVSLARGSINTHFDLNIHAFYSINIGFQNGGNLVCSNGAGLETRRLSSLGELPVYRYQWLEKESRAAGRDTIAGSFLGGFEGRRGYYRLQIEVLSDTACLNVGNPRLYVIASNEDFMRWNRYDENAFWISFVLGSIGFGILIVGIRESLRRRFKGAPLEIKSPVASIYRTQREAKPSPWIRFLPQIGLLYSQIILVLAICVFIVYLGFARTSSSAGLYVKLPGHAPYSNCGDFDVIVLKISKEHSLSINSDTVSTESLRGRLRDLYRLRAERVLLIRADSDVSFKEVAGVIDMAQGAVTNLYVVLITPEAEKEPCLFIRRPPVLPNVSELPR